MQFIIKLSAFFFISVISSGLAGAQKNIDINDVNITSKLLTGISVPNQGEIVLFLQLVDMDIRFR